MKTVLKSRTVEHADAAALLRMMAEFNAGEGIPFNERDFAPAVDKLIRSPELGAALIFEADGAIGYAVVTWGFDLEFGGRDAFLTELWIDPVHRGNGYGKAALQYVEQFAAINQAGALHLGVRPENAPACRLYESTGYQDWPRRFMTKLL